MRGRDRLAAFLRPVVFGEFLSPEEDVGDRQVDLFGNLRILFGQDGDVPPDDPRRREMNFDEGGR